MPQLSPFYWVMAALFGVFIFMMMIYCYSSYDVSTVFYYKFSDFNLFEWSW